MKEKIKLYIISGFLGAGKTTFLKRLLAYFSGGKVGVLVNEFGAINVDGKTIDRNGITYKEINDGSIFCSCLKASFVKTLVALQKEDIDFLIIENSGLADPSNMNRLLAEMEKQMDRGYAYQGSVCLVDALTFLDYIDVLCAIENQILSSNYVIVNKTDLVPEETVRRVMEAIGNINGSAQLIPAVQADVPLEILEKSLNYNGFDKETSNTPCARPETYALACGGSYERKGLAAFLKAVSKNTLRVKGFIRTKEGWYHVDAVGAQCGLNPIRDEPGMEQGLVLIGKGSVPFKDQVIKSWTEYMHDSPQLEDD